ncbi:hypothetical protein [Limnoglobus roseus]|uniref:Uncharacterized protein n=1 Tax=Limnoglobus roseus TaxID=2598579 RepID=A0A5C1AG32_9BACT|nr:hypothetical protein [Limnoglobus roseus]QEL16702.1 hypothetical protein PX52LOC_03665 [Limnoglobus roseus]
MTPYRQSRIGKQVNGLLGGFAVGFLVVLLFALCSCVSCPAGKDALCPTFPTAAPRQ